jgi:hypothetical protein
MPTRGTAECPRLDRGEDFLRTRYLLVLAGIMACGSDPAPGTGVNPTEVASLAITATPAAIVTVGQTVQLSAKAYNATFDEIANAEITWISANDAIATVSATGLVTGVAEGVTNVTARAGTRSVDAEIVVNADYCQTPLNLQVGQVKVLSGPTAVSCVTIGATTGPSDFLFVTANAAPQQDNLGFYNVTLPQLVSASAARLSAEAAQAVLIAERDPRAVVERRAIEYRDAFEDGLRRAEANVVRSALASRSRPTSSRLSSELLVSPSVAVAAAPAIGDQVSYRVPNVKATKPCQSFTEVTGVVKAVGTKVVLVQDVKAPAGGFTPQDFTAIAQEFDNHIFPADTLWFGSPTDRDSDGMVTILFTPEVNELTPQGATGFTAGFFWGGDLFLKSEYPTSDPCPQTNEKEIFYMLVPDPNGTINGNARTTVTVRQGTRGVIAHELQHMINQSVRMFNQAVKSLETSWLNEAMSHMAEEAVGRRERNFDDNQPLGFADVNPNPQQQDDYNAFFRQNMARLRTWMFRPDTASPISAKARTELAPRGAGWLLVRYAADHYGGGNPRTFFRNLARGPEIDVANLLARAQNVQFDQLLSGFLVAVFDDDFGTPGIAPRYTIPSWKLRDLMTQYNGGAYPLAVTDLPTTISTQSLSGSGNYFRLTLDHAAPQTQFKMQQNSGSPVTFGGARVYVLRLQ